LDENIIKWQGRVYDAATEGCKCKSGFVDIGSRDCYNETFNMEFVTSQKNCGRGNYFSLEFFSCLPCESTCDRCITIA
jgi:hypothetical protein